jgi:hypothetical protein
MPQPVIDLIVTYGIKFLALLLGLGTLYVGSLLRGLIVAKIGESNLERFLKGVEVVVRALEQEGLLRHYSGEEKKQMASVLLQDFAKNLGLTLDPEQISLFIEHFVQILNTEAGKFEEPPQLLQGISLTTDRARRDGGPIEVPLVADLESDDPDIIIAAVE